MRAASPGAIAFFIVLAVAVSAAASYSLWALSSLPSYTTGDVYLGGALTYTFYPVSLPNTQGYSYRVYLINDKPYRAKADIVAIFTDGSTATNCTTAAGGVVSTTGIEVPPKTSVEVTCTYPKQVLSIQVYEYGYTVQRASGAGYVGTVPGSGILSQQSSFQPPRPGSIYTFEFTIQFKRIDDKDLVPTGYQPTGRYLQLDAYDAYRQFVISAGGVFPAAYAECLVRHGTVTRECFIYASVQYARWSLSWICDFRSSWRDDMYFGLARCRYPGTSSYQGEWYYKDGKVYRLEGCTIGYDVEDIDINYWGSCYLQEYVVRYSTVYTTRYLGAWLDYDPGPGFAPSNANLGTHDKPGALVTTYTTGGLLGVHTLYVRVSAPCDRQWEVSAHLQVKDMQGRPLRSMNLGTVTAACGLATFQFRFP